MLDWSEELQELHIATRKQRLQQALDLVKQYADTEGSVVDELIRERREAALNE